MRLDSLKLQPLSRKADKEVDDQYAKTLYNLGLAYYGMGDFASQRRYCESSLEVERKIIRRAEPFYPFRPTLILHLHALVFRIMKKRSNIQRLPLIFSDNNPGSADIFSLAGFYSNLGVLYISLADFSKAKVYLEKV